jgi:hypothetical protein
MTEHQEGKRAPDGEVLHDGVVNDPVGCPRRLPDCKPLSRFASPRFGSFMCCGETAAAPVPTDRLRLCVKAEHKHGVDLTVNFDERDAVHTASVLLGGLAALGSVRITASATA